MSSRRPPILLRFLAIHLGERFDQVVVVALGGRFESDAQLRGRHRTRCDADPLAAAVIEVRSESDRSCSTLLLGRCVVFENRPEALEHVTGRPTSSVA